MMKITFELTLDKINRDKAWGWHKMMEMLRGRYCDDVFKRLIGNEND